LLTSAVEDALARHGRVPEAVRRDRPLVVGVVAGLARLVGSGEPALERRGFLRDGERRDQQRRGGESRSRSHGVVSSKARTAGRGPSPARGMTGRNYFNSTVTFSILPVNLNGSL